jgi:hypothetical protein
MNPDRDHLQLLSIFHNIAGVLAALAGLLPIIHLVLGIGLLTDLPSSESAMGGVVAGLALVGVALVLMVAFFGMSWAAFRSAKNLAAYQNHGFCVAVACVECIFFPLGTTLGVFTLIVLLRPSVKELFGVPPAAPLAPPFGRP